MVRVWVFRLCSLPSYRLLGANGTYRSRFASSVRLVPAFRSLLLGASLLVASCCCKAVTAKHATKGWDLGWASRSSCTGNGLQGSRHSRSLQASHLPLNPQYTRLESDGIDGYRSNRQAGVSKGKPRKRSGLGLPETIGNGLQGSRHSRSLQAVYTPEIGVYETTGNNDHPRIDEYLRYVGLGPGYAWCAAFVSWVHGQAGYPEPRNAWSPALFPEKRVVWRQGNGNVVRPGDVFGIYYNNLHRIGHCGFVDSWSDTNCITVEGNTGPDGAINLNTTSRRLGGDGLDGYRSNQQADVSKGKPRKRSGLGLPETIGNGLQGSRHSHHLQAVYNPANPIRAGPAKQGVYRKRRPIRTIHTVARWT